MRRGPRNCRGMPTEVAVVGVADLGSVGGGVRTRSRSLSMAAAAAAASAGNSMTNLPAPTRATFRNGAGTGEFIRCGDDSLTCAHRRRERRRVLIGANSENPFPISSDSGVASCVDEGSDYSDDATTSATLSLSYRSKNGSSSAQQRPALDLICFTDPEEEEENDDELVNETKAIMSPNCRKRRETTPLYEFEAESGLAMDPKAMRASLLLEAIDSHHRLTIKKMPSEAEIEEFFAVAEKDLQKRFAEKYNFDVVKDVPLEGRYQWDPVKP